MEAESESESRDPRLDGLRGIAVLAVFAFHTTLYGAERTRLDSALAALPSLRLLVAVLTAPTGSVLARLCEWSVLREIGRVSYALYLVQLAVFGAIWSSVHPVFLAWPYPVAQLGIWVLCGCASYAIAWASWAGIESRALALKRHLPYRL